MSRREFFDLLKQEGIDPETVAFDSSISSGYNIRKNSSRWEAFYRMKGKEYDCVGFYRESDALQFMYRMLVANNKRMQGKNRSVCAV